MGTALITGASAGIGRELAKIFAANGHSLILVARRKAALQELAAEIQKSHPQVRVDLVDLDLGFPGAGSSLFERVEGLKLSVDFLVNNAGVGTNGSFAELPLEKELQLLDLNIRSLVEITRLFLPSMKARKFGRILNIGSTAGFQPGPFMADYYASKAFVNSFSQALHEELRGTGVSSTVLTPGATATEFAKVAKIETSNLFQGGLVATAESVAREGFRAMEKGQRLAVPGVFNKVLIQSQRVAPKFALVKIAGWLNQAK